MNLINEHKNYRRWVDWKAQREAWIFQRWDTVFLILTSSLNESIISFVDLGFWTKLSHYMYQRKVPSLAILVYFACFCFEASTDIILAYSICTLQLDFGYKLWSLLIPSLHYMIITIRMTWLWKKRCSEDSFKDSILRYPLLLPVR